MQNHAIQQLLWCMSVEIDPTSLAASNEMTSWGFSMREVEPVAALASSLLTPPSPTLLLVGPAVLSVPAAIAKQDGLTAKQDGQTAKWGGQTAH